MPVNSSRPATCCNADDFAAAGIETSPATREAFKAVLRSLEAARPDKCNLGCAPSTRVDHEQFSMAQGVLVDPKNVGHDGLDAECVCNPPGTSRPWKR